MSTLTNKDLAARAPIALAADSFVRTDTAGNVTVGNAAGWGTPSDNPPSADTWTKSGGTSASFSIVSNTGQVTSATTAGVCFLGSTTYADPDVLLRVQADHTNDTMGIAFRGSSSTNTYRLRLLSGTTLRFDKNIGGTVTTIAGASFTWSASTLYWIRMRAVGQFLYGRVWADGSSEPTTWTVSTADTALTSGQVGVYFNPNATADKIAFDHLAVTDALSHDKDLATRVNVGVLQRKDIATRAAVQALSPRDLLLRAAVQALSPRDLLSRVRLASQPQQKNLATRSRIAGQPLRNLVARILLTVPSVPLVRDLAVRILLVPDLNEGASLFPLPAQASPAMGGAVLPIARPTGGAYAVGGVALPDQPTVCTAPFVAGTTIPAGALFSLTWNTPSGAVQAALSDGSVVTLTFAVYPGTMVSGQVRVSSALVGTAFVATFTTLAPISLTVWVVQTQFL